MYGCSNAVLVYGFNLGTSEYIIDYDYLEDKFPGISQYALDVIRNYLGEAVYGISCGLDKETGQVIITPEEKEKVNILYNKYVEYLKNQFEEDFENMMKKSQLGFHLVVSGDYEICQDTVIILDNDWVKEEEDEYEEELVDKEANLEHNLFNQVEDEDDEIEQKTYKGVYYDDAMDMEKAMKEQGFNR